MIVELMRPAGPDLVRRWVAALLAAPESEREAIVERVERRVAELYPGENAPGDAEREPEVAVKARAARSRSAG